MRYERGWRVLAVGLWLAALGVGFATGSVPAAIATLAGGFVAASFLYGVFAVANEGPERERNSTLRVNEQGELVEDK